MVHIFGCLGAWGINVKRYLTPNLVQNAKPRLDPPLLQMRIFKGASKRITIFIKLCSIHLDRVNFPSLLLVGIPKKVLTLHPITQGICIQHMCV